MRNWKRVVTLAAAVAVTVGATSAFAQSLTVIPKLRADDTSNQALGITPDGKYVVGISSGSAESGWLTKGYIWDATNGTNWVLSSDNAGAATAHGIGYRTSGGQKEIIVNGMSAGYVTEWMKTDSTGFDVKRRDTTYTQNVTSLMNQLGTMEGSDAYYAVSRNAAAGNLAPTIRRAVGPWLPTIDISTKNTTENSRMNAVSGNGRAVGRRLEGGVGKNYTMYYAGAGAAAAYFAGLDGSTRGEAFGVSLDGTVVVGGSPLVAADPANALNGYKAVFSSWNNNTLVSINALPLDPAGVYTSTTKSPAYGASENGDWIVGYHFPGQTRAALWDTRDANPANWTLIDLTTWAQTYNLLDGWTVLSRAYSVGVNAQGNPVVSGEGLYGGQTRAFVLTIPEPATMALLALGGLMLRRRR